MARQEDTTTTKRRWGWAKEFGILLVAGLVLSMGIKTFAVQAFSIPSDSMNNTLVRGDRVLVDKYSPWFGWTPSRGDVVVFQDPGGWLNGPEYAPSSGGGLGGDLTTALSWIGLAPSTNQQFLIKRVIAVGGDHVTCKAGAPVSVDGVALDEPYIFPGATPCGDYPVGTVTVPQGDLWVMGDHRNDSADSRYQRDAGNAGGFVPVKDVVGRAFVVAWPIDHWATLPVPATFHQPGLSQGDGSLAAPVGWTAMGLVVVAVPVVLVARRRRSGARRKSLSVADLP